MLPRLAAMVCSTIMGIMLFSQPSCISSAKVKGTNTSSATSLVTSMEEKKGSSTKAMPSTRPLLMRRSI